MTKYHLKDDGVPGRCSAQSTESCPKTKAGDSFHGSLEEVTRESERRFAETHNNIPEVITKKVELNKEEEIINETFGNRDHRVQLGNVAIAYHDAIWSKGASKEAYTKKFAKIADVDEKDVVIGEEYSLVKKDGKYLSLGPAGMYSEDDWGDDVSPMTGELYTDEEVRDNVDQFGDNEEDRANIIRMLNE